MAGACRDAGSRPLFVATPMQHTSKPSVLLIAPHSSDKLPLLPWVDTEIESIVNSGLPVHLERDINQRKLVELTTDTKYNIVWFATHGTEKGIYLSDGLLGTDAITTILRNAGAHYVVLNTCDSIHVAVSISEETGADVICTVSDVGDQEAWRTAAYLAKHLARGLTVQAAFKMSRPASHGKYVYLPGFNGADNRRELQEKISELTAALASGQPERVEEIISSLADLNMRVARLESRQSVTEAKLSPPIGSIALFLLAIIVLVIAVVVALNAFNNPVLMEILVEQPVIVVTGVIVTFALIVTWIVLAFASVREHVEQSKRQP